MALLSLIQASLTKLPTEDYIFGAAGLVSLVAFGALILAPALGSFSRPWEKAAAGFLSLFVLVALVLAGLILGLIIFYNWDTISQKI